MAIDSDTVVAGSPWDGDGSSNSGSIVFHTTDGGAHHGQVAKLTADASSYNYFGFSMAIDSDTIVAGAACSWDSCRFLCRASLGTTDGGARLPGGEADG